MVLVLQVFLMLFILSVSNINTNFNSTFFGHINNNDYLCRTKVVDNPFIRYIGSNLILVESPMSSSVE